MSRPSSTFQRDYGAVVAILIEKLLARCYTSEHRFPYCNDVEPYSIHRIRNSSFEKPGWITHNGLRINPDYRELFGIK